MFRQFATFAVLVLLVGVIRLLLADYDGVVRDKIIEASRTAGIVAEVGQVDLHFPGALAVSGAKLVIPSKILPIPLDIDDISLNLGWMQLLLLRMQLSGEAHLYRGTLQSRVQTGLFSGGPSVEITGSGLQLSAHPILKTFQISGLADVELAGAFPNQLATTEDVLAGTGEATLRMREGSFPGGQMIAGVFKVPGASEIQGTVHLGLDSGVVTIKRLALASSIGSVRGGGTFGLTGKGIDRADVSLSIVLTDAGREALAEYLALVANLPIDSSRAVWQLQILQTAGQLQPRITVQPG